MKTRKQISDEIKGASDGIMEEKLVQKNILITLLDIRGILAAKAFDRIPENARKVAEEAISHT